MPLKIDYLYDDSFDLLIESGDFKQGDATLQQAKVRLNSNKGDLKRDGLAGANLIGYVGSSVDIDIIDAAIREDLKEEGILLVDIETTKKLNTVTSEIKVQ